MLQGLLLLSLTSDRRYIVLFLLDDLVLSVEHIGIVLKCLQHLGISPIHIIHCMIHHTLLFGRRPIAVHGWCALDNAPILHYPNCI